MGDGGEDMPQMTTGGIQTRVKPTFRTVPIYGAFFNPAHHPGAPSSRHLNGDSGTQRERFRRLAELHGTERIITDPEKGVSGSQRRT